MTDRGELAGPGTAALARLGESGLARPETSQEVLVFEVGGDRMALPLASVKEILKLAPITPVPRARRDVLGILSVRGRITTVLDLRRRLGLDEGPPSRNSRILLVERAGEVVGLRVDGVSAVLRLRSGEIEPAEVIGAGLAEYVSGLGRPRGARDSDAEAEVVILLDPNALLRR